MSDDRLGLGDWEREAGPAKAIMRFVAIRALRVLADDPTVFRKNVIRDVAVMTIGVVTIVVAENM